MTFEYHGFGNQTVRVNVLKEFTFKIMQSRC